MGDVVLALDPGTCCGWALAGEGMAKPRGGVYDLPDVERDIGLFAEAFVDWIVPFARLEKVTRIVAEGPLIVQHRDKITGRTSVNMHEVETLVGIFTIAAYATRILGLPKMTRGGRSTVCKHFIACGGGENYKRPYLKAATIAMCQKRGWNVTLPNGEVSEDLADAKATLDWFVHDQGIKVGWDCQPAAGPLFQGQPGVRIDASNQRAAARVLNSAISFERGKHGND